MEPNQADLVLNELEVYDFILEQDTYCYFRDEIFIKEMENFIKKLAPGKWQETAMLEGTEKVEKCYVNQDLIHKYYPKYNKCRQKFYVYNNQIYVYEFLGFMNVANEIQLMKLETQDVVNLLNQLAEQSLRKLLRKIGIA